ncbi:hypothetical protein WA026_016659, partial [Henosepilachna vigintioctopunctata]
MCRHIEFLKYKDERYNTSIIPFVFIFYKFYILFFSRVRNYKIKTERGTTSKGVYDSAAAEVVYNKTSIRKSSEMVNLCPMSLSRYVRKYKTNESCSLSYVKPRL